MSDALTLDTTLKVAEIISIIAGGGLVLVRMTKMTTEFQQIGIKQAEEISELKKNIQELSKLVTDVAVQNTRLTNIEQRMNDQGQRMNETQREIASLRRGEGFIAPADR